MCVGFCLGFLNQIIVYKKERMGKNREGELGLCFRAKLSKKLPSSSEKALQHLSSLKSKGENGEKAGAKEAGRTMNHLLGWSMPATPASLLSTWNSRAHYDGCSSLCSVGATDTLQLQWDRAFLQLAQLLSWNIWIQTLLCSSFQQCSSLRQHKCRGKKQTQNWSLLQSHEGKEGRCDMVTCSREETPEFRQEQCPEEMQREAFFIQTANFGVFMVPSCELNTINAPHWRRERLKALLTPANLSCGKSSLILEVQLTGGCRSCLPQHKKRTRQRTMHFAMASAPALAITDLSQVTLNLVHSRLCTSAHKINLLKPGQLCKTSRQTKPR